MSVAQHNPTVIRLGRGLGGIRGGCRLRYGERIGMGRSGLMWIRRSDTWWCTVPGNGRFSQCLLPFQCGRWAGELASTLAAVELALTGDSLPGTKVSVVLWAAFVIAPVNLAT